MKYRIRRHGGVHLRQRHRRLLFPGSQHAPAGGARRHRRGHRNRPGGMDGAPGRGRDAVAGHAYGSPARRARFRCASMPKIPPKNFSPAPGRLSQVVWPAAARVETWVESGTEVTPYYDPMLAKIIVHGEDRASALVTHARRAGGVPRLRHRDQSRISAPGDAPTPLSPPAASRHAYLRGFPLSPPRHRCARSRHADHRAGLSRPPRLLARRRAALGSDGRAGVPHRQSTGGQSEKAPRAWKSR